MAVIVALLRGINVGASKRMKMDALRQVFTGLGLEQSQTYLQSGNVVFQSDEEDAGELAKRIEAGIEQRFGFRSAVVLRSAAQWRQVIDENPFTSRPEIDPAKLLVIFLAGAISAAEKKAIQEIKVASEELSVGSTEIFVYYPDGMGRSKLNVALDKALKTTGTGRNWNSVANIQSLIEKFSSPAAGASEEIGGIRRSETTDRRNRPIRR